MVDLKEEVPGLILLVLAVVCIFLPLYFLIGNVFLTNQENSNAQKTLDNLITKISDLKNSEGNNFIIQGFKGADNWYLVGWSKDEPGRPDKCFFTNGCLCLCRYDSTLPSNPVRSFNLNNSCQNGGFCKEVSSKTVEVYYNYSQTTIAEKYPGMPLCYIKLKNNLISLTVTKNDSNLNILTYLSNNDISSDTRERFAYPNLLLNYGCNA